MAIKPSFMILSLKYYTKYNLHFPVIIRITNYSILFFCLQFGPQNNGLKFELFLQMAKNRSVKKMFILHMSQFIILWEQAATVRFKRSAIEPAKHFAAVVPFTIIFSKNSNINSNMQFFTEHIHKITHMQHVANIFFLNIQHVIESNTFSAIRCSMTFIALFAAFFSNALHENRAGITFKFK